MAAVFIPVSVGWGADDSARAVVARQSRKAETFIVSMALKHSKMN